MTDIQIALSDLMLPDKGKTIKVVTLAGQLDESNVDESVKTVYDAIATAAQGMSFIIDFENLVYLNSKAVGYITDWYGKITAKQGKMVLTKLPANINDILTVVGLTRIVPVAQTMEEAKSLA